MFDGMEMKIKIFYLKIVDISKIAKSWEILKSHEEDILSCYETWTFFFKKILIFIELGDNTYNCQHLAMWHSTKVYGYQVVVHITKKNGKCWFKIYVYDEISSVKVNMNCEHFSFLAQSLILCR